MKKNKLAEIVELNIDSVGFEGVCVSRLNDKVVFTKFTAPGDIVNAQILKNKKRFFEARIDSFVKKSPHRIEPKCRHFGDCGGCQWQHLDYKQQLYWKETNVRDVFERIGKVSVSEYKSILSANEQFSYRNKMEFSFGSSRWLSQEEIQTGIDIENKDFAFGLYIAGRYDKILDIHNCEIQSNYANDILNEIRRYLIINKLNAYNTRTYEGFMRSFIIRRSLYNDDYMTILIAQTAKLSKEKEFIEWYKTEFANNFDKISNIVYAVNNSNNPVNISDTHILKGTGYLTEDILGVKYRISPFSFFQTNSFMLNSFISLIIENAEISSDMIVWDLYCGTGSITLPAAKYAKKIIGIELVQSSIFDAEENAKLNGIDNAEFICSNLHNKEIPELLNSLEKPDIVILDPPRAGINQNLINHLLELSPKRIVYVSCNPATQARDCSILSEKYDIETVQSVDMFPHTYHIESIVKLNLRAI